MHIKIFDVAHGFCAFIIADNNNCALVDCGHNDETGFHPATHLFNQGRTGIERFFVTNYDEDHVSGLPKLLDLSWRMPIQILYRNRSVTPDALRAIKRQTGGPGPGIEALLGLMDRYNSSVAAEPDFPGVDFQTFCNEYPLYTDTNNLSLVLFIHYPGLSIVFPGDIEAAGWRSLLRNDQFRANLTRVNIFVASHHGRENGYAPEVFECCKPDIVVISDEKVQYSTQEQQYGQHARGIRWNQTDTRKVLTTRKDGALTITSVQGGYHVNASR